MLTFEGEPFQGTAPIVNKLQVCAALQAKCICSRIVSRFADANCLLVTSLPANRASSCNPRRTAEQREWWNQDTCQRRVTGMEPYTMKNRHM